MVGEGPRLAAVDAIGIGEVLVDAAAERDVEHCIPRQTPSTGRSALDRGAGEGELDPVAQRIAGLVAGSGSAP